MNSLISVHNTVNKALDNMGMESTDEVPKLVDWAIEADKKIDSYYNFVERIHVIKGEECSAKLPCGTHHVVGVLLGNCGTDCSLLFDRGLMRTSAGKVTAIRQGLVVIDSSEQEIQISGLIYTVQDNKLVFEGKIAEDGRDGFVTVKTLGYKLDDDGFPLINENHVTAIGYYLEWKLMMRERWRNGGRQFSLGERKDMENRWDIECSDARATDNARTVAQEEQLANLYNDPLTGYYQNYQLTHPDYDNVYQSGFGY